MRACFLLGPLLGSPGQGPLRTAKALPRGLPRGLPAAAWWGGAGSRNAWPVSGGGGGDIEDRVPKRGACGTGPARLRGAGGRQRGTHAGARWLPQPAGRRSRPVDRSPPRHWFHRQPRPVGAPRRAADPNGRRLADGGGARLARLGGVLCAGLCQHGHPRLPKWHTRPHRASPCLPSTPGIDWAINSAWSAILGPPPPTSSCFLSSVRTSGPCWPD
jgi:hypothetical protein